MLSLKPNPNPSLKLEPRLRGTRKRKVDSKPEAKTESKPEAKSEVEAKPKPEAKAKTPSDLTPQIATRAYELYEQQGHRDGQSVQNWNRAEREIRKDQAKPEPKPEAKAEPESETKAESKPAAKVEAKPEAEIEPKHAPKVQPPPDAKIEPNARSQSQDAFRFDAADRRASPCTLRAVGT